MASVQLADIYNPVTFAQWTQEAQIENNAFYQSGIVTDDARLNAMLSQGGNTGQLPAYNELGDSEPNYSDDNPATNSTPDNNGISQMDYRSAQQNKSWSVMDLAQELALADPAEAITNRIGAYWAQVNSRRVIQSCLGVYADNVANDSGDMVNDLYSDIASPLAANLISGNAVIDTVQTRGDRGEQFAAIAIHSVVYSQLKKQNLIDFIPNARGEVVIPTYMNLTVIVDDTLPVIAGTNSPSYTSVLFERGAFIGGQGMVENPMELDRDPSSGNGGGQTIMYSRRNDVFHPLGLSYVGTPSGQSATRAELATAASWDRVWERKNIGMAFLRTNG
jgi:hypothetical protein